MTIENAAQRMTGAPRFTQLLLPPASACVRPCRDSNYDRLYPALQDRSTFWTSRGTASVKRPSPICVNSRALTARRHNHRLVRPPPSVRLAGFEATPCPRPVRPGAGATAPVRARSGSSVSTRASGARSRCSTNASLRLRRSIRVTASGWRPPRHAVLSACSRAAASSPSPSSKRARRPACSSSSGSPSMATWSTPTANASPFSP